MATVLERLGVELVEKTESGKPATGVKVLEDIRENSEITAAAKEVIDLILEFRKFAKLKGTYAEGLAQQINPYTGRVHTSFNLAGTATGRLSSSDPNLQNIPVRTAEGKLIREAFIAAPGHKLISADYSQIELRVLAHICRDNALLRAFHEGRDIHAAAAAEVWNLPIDQVPADKRRDAKAVNFGIVYGSMAFGLAMNLGIPVVQAEALIERYFQRFPGIRDYMDYVTRKARELGYVRTLEGRRVWFPDIKSRNCSSPWAAPIAS